MVAAKSAGDLKTTAASPAYAKIILSELRNHKMTFVFPFVCEQLTPWSPYLTGLLRVPIPSTVTDTSSPEESGPTPAGVPVSKMSPGSKVIT